MKKVYIAIIIIFIIIAISIVIGIVVSNNVKNNQDTINNNIIDNTVDNEAKGDIKIKYNDNQIVAIGYISSDENEQQFINKYFKDASIYNNYKIYDFRSDYSVEGNKFVIIPKNDEVSAIVYACEFTEDNELVIKNNLIDLKSTGGYIIKTNYTEYNPNVSLKIKYNGFEDDLIIDFSGENGHLNISGYEYEVIDVSIYND